MQSFIIDELMQLFFNNCDKDPQIFVANFNHSARIIGFNFRCKEQRFTHISDSFKVILGYNHQNVLKNGNFTSKLVHPQDKQIIDDCLRKSYLQSRAALQRPDFYSFTQVKCRAKHIRGYWKYFIVYAKGYWNELARTNDKIGVIVDERIRTIQEKDSRKEDGPGSMDPDTLNLNSGNNESEEKSNNISPRENEILEMISNGLVTKEIADQLHISDSTVITHRKNLILKLNVRNTAELIKKASKHMLI